MSRAISLRGLSHGEVPAVRAPRAHPEWPGIDPEVALVLARRIEEARASVAAGLRLPEPLEVVAAPPHGILCDCARCSSAARTAAAERQAEWDRARAAARADAGRIVAAELAAASLAPGPQPHVQPCSCGACEAWHARRQAAPSLRLADILERARQAAHSGPAPAAFPAPRVRDHLDGCDCRDCAFVRDFVAGRTASAGHCGCFRRECHACHPVEPVQHVQSGTWRCGCPACRPGPGRPLPLQRQHVEGVACACDSCTTTLAAVTDSRRAGAMSSATLFELWRRMATGLLRR